VVPSVLNNDTIPARKGTRPTGDLSAHFELFLHIYWCLASMASFVVKQAIGGKISGMKGGLDKLTGGGEGGGEAKAEAGEDPEVVQARIEAEERRKDKHRKQEMEREKMRQDIRDKYKITKKEEDSGMEDCAGRIGAAKKKTPEELAKQEEEEESLMGQVNGMFGKAKAAVSGVADTVKGLLPFGK